MKAVILALLVLLVVSQGEALRCRCGRFCRETCLGSNPVCGSIVRTFGYKVYLYQKCMSSFGCQILSRYASYAVCCDRDLCN